jgi:hypothetical protein
MVIHRRNMTRLLTFLIFASLAVPGLSQSRCPSLSTLVVDVDYIIEGTASKDGQPLWGGAEVSLYSRGKLVRGGATDWQGGFTLDHLPVGTYRLSIQGVGSFDVKVVPSDPFKQRRHYGFALTNGCRTWGFSTN